MYAKGNKIFTTRRYPRSSPQWYNHDTSPKTPRGDEWCDGGSQNRMAARWLSDSQSHPGTITSDSLMHVIKCSYQTAETCLKFYLFTYSVSSCTLSAHQGGDSWLMEVYCESRHSAVVVVSTFPVYVTARDKKLNVILEVDAFQQSGVRRRTLTIFMW